MGFFEKAKRVIAKNQEYFTLLEELDRTGRLRKLHYKEKVTFTIDDDAMSKFRRYCEEQGKKMSSVVEAAIKNIVSK